MAAPFVEHDVEIALDADQTKSSGAYVWTNVTQYVRAKNSIHITQGRTDGYQSVPPSTCTMLVDNRDGRWIARNPTGAWYGKLRRNTPIRVLGDSANWPVEVSDTFGRTSTASWVAADTGQPWNSLYGVGGTVADTDWTVTGGKGIHKVPTTSAYRISWMEPRPLLADQDVTVTVTCPQATGAPLEPANLYIRALDQPDFGSLSGYMLRCQVTTGNAVQLTFIKFDEDGVESSLTSLLTISGITHSAATALNVRARVYGTTLMGRVWQGSTEPSIWHLTYTDPDPFDLSGFVGVRSGVASGNTNSKPVTFSYDNFIVTKPPVRFAGFIDELPVKVEAGEVDNTVALQCSGYFRRLNQGDLPEQSAMWRDRVQDDHLPLEYWPMEEDSGAVQFSSACGGKPIPVLDQQPGASSVVLGSKNLPTWGSAIGRAAVRGHPNGYSSQIETRFVFVMTQLPSGNYGLADWVTLSGTWRVAISTVGQIFLQFIDNFGNERVGVSGIISGFFASYGNRPTEVFLQLQQSGTSVNWNLTVYSIDAASLVSQLSSVSGTVSSVTMYWPTQVRVDPRFGGAGPFVLGHLALYDRIAGGVLGALVGGAGETATLRIRRTCEDAGVPVSTSVNSDETGEVTQLGVQPVTSIPGLLQDAANADGGILHEAEFEVSYLARYELYNRPVDLVLDGSLGHLSDFQPTDDDQQTRNDVTVSRSRGTSFRATDDESYALYGRYDTSLTLGLQFDSDVAPHAYWRVGLGTVDDMRYPTIELNLRGTPQLLTAWKRCKVGSRIQIINPPGGLPQETIDLLLQGWSETLDEGAGIWTVTLNCVSFRPYQVFQLESTAENLGRLSSGASTLNSLATSTATSFSVATAGPTWPTGATSVQLWCDGELVRCTNISGSSSPQTFTVTRSLNGVVKSHAAGVPIDLYRPGTVAL